MSAGAPYKARYAICTTQNGSFDVKETPEEMMKIIEGMGGLVSGSILGFTNIHGDIIIVNVSHFICMYPTTIPDE